MFLEKISAKSRPMMVGVEEGLCMPVEQFGLVIILVSIIAHSVFCIKTAFLRQEWCCLNKSCYFSRRWCWNPVPDATATRIAMEACPRTRQPSSCETPSYNASWKHRDHQLNEKCGKLDCRLNWTTFQFTILSYMAFMKHQVKPWGYCNFFFVIRVLLSHRKYCFKGVRMKSSTFSFFDLFF